MQNLENRILNITREMDVRNLEMLFEVLQAEVESLEEEKNRNAVFEIVKEKLDIIEQMDEGSSEDGDE